MTRDEAIELIHMELGFRTDQTANIIKALKFAQTSFENRPSKPWFLLSEKATITTTINEQRLQVPTDFIMEHEENGLTYIPTDTDDKPVSLEKDDYDILRDYWGRSTGVPEDYSFNGKYFRIFPIPDAVYTIEMLYYKRDTALDTNIENEWLKWAAKALMGAAGKTIASALRDKAAVQTFVAWEREGLVELYTENEQRKHTNTNYQIGGTH